MSGLQQLMMSNFSSGESDPIVGATTAFNVGSQNLSVSNSSLAYNPDNNVFLFAFRHENVSGTADQGRARAFTINSNNTVTMGSSYTFSSSSDTDDISVDYDTNINKFVISYRDDADDEKIKARTCTVAANRTMSFGGTVTLDASGNLSDTQNVFASNVNRNLVVFEDDDDTDNLLARNIQANSNGTITLRTQGTVQAGNQSYGDPNLYSAAYGNSRVLIAYGTGLRVKAASVTSTSFSVGGALNLSTNTAISGANQSMEYSPDTARFYIQAQNTLTASPRVYMWCVSNSGSTLTNRGVTTLSTTEKTNSAMLTYEPTRDKLISAEALNNPTTTNSRIVIREMTPTSTGVTTDVITPIDSVTTFRHVFGLKRASNGKCLLIHNQGGTNNAVARVYVPTGLA